MKRKIKRVSASVALFMIGLMFSLPFFAISANAETSLWDWRTERSGTIHQVVEFREHTGSHFNLSYEVKGGRDFRLHYDTQALGSWRGEVKATPGEVITVSYTANYPTPMQVFKLETVAKDYTFENSLYENIYYRCENEESKLVYKDLHTIDKESSSTTIEGSISLNVPRLEDIDIRKTGEDWNIITMRALSSLTQIRNNDKKNAETARLPFIIDVIVDMDESGAVNDGTVQNASTDNGETGTAVPAAIVFSTLAAGAGVVGAVAAGGSKPSGTNDDNSGGSYKMYVGKDFGNGIRKGAKPVKIRARMVEVKNGRETPRPELNKNISFSGQDMNIISAVLTGTHIEVMVSVAADCNSENAILTFLYNGEGGTFRNNIIFKVVGDPHIKYDREPSEGFSCGPYAEAVFGDKSTYKMKFHIADTTGYPGEIRVKNLTDEISATIERDPAVEYGYILSVVNKTAKPKEKKIFYDREEILEAEINAVFEDGTKIDSRAGLAIYPEGILIEVDKKDINNNNLVIRTIPDGVKDASAEVENSEAPPTNYRVHLIYIDRNGKTVHLQNPEFKLSDPEDNGKYGKVFTNSFKYKYSKTSANIYGASIKSLVSLPMLDEPYYVSMGISINHDGMTFSENLPVAVYGEASRQR